MDKVCSEWDVSIRRACRVLSVDTSTYHYKSRRRGQADLEQRIKEIAETRMRYGYRRVHVVLQREGWMTNIKRTYRLYTAQGLQLRNKNASAESEGETQGGPLSGLAAEPDLGDGLRPRPAGDGQEDQGADRRRHLLEVLAGRRSSLQRKRPVIYAASAWSWLLAQFHGSNSVMRLMGWSAMRARTEQR